LNKIGYLTSDFNLNFDKAVIYIMWPGKLNAKKLQKH